MLSLQLFALPLEFRLQSLLHLLVEGVPLPLARLLLRRAALGSRLEFLLHCRKRGGGILAGLLCDGDFPVQLGDRVIP